MANLNGTGVAPVDGARGTGSVHQWPATGSQSTAALLSRMDQLKSAVVAPEPTMARSETQTACRLIASLARHSPSGPIGFAHETSTLAEDR